MKSQGTGFIMIITLFLLCAQTIPQPAAGQDMSVMVISLDDFINGAIKANPKIFAELAKSKQADAQALQSKAVYDVVFNLHYNRIHDKPYNALSASLLQESDTDNFGAGFSWIAHYTGTRLKAGLDYNSINVKVLNSPMPAKTIDLYNPEIYFEVQQPLLRNGEALVKTIDNKFRAGLADATDLAKTRIMNLGFFQSRDQAEARRKYLAKKIFVWMKGEKALPMTKDLAPGKNIRMIPHDRLKNLITTITQSGCPSIIPFRTPLRGVTTRKQNISLSIRNVLLFSCSVSSTD